MMLEEYVNPTILRGGNLAVLTVKPPNGFLK